MNLAIEHHQEKKEFFAFAQGEKCFISYQIQGQVMDLQHTVVPEKLGGKGYAGELTIFVLEYARKQNYKILPTCPYVANYIKKHQEFSNLISQ
jgi:hypothetical protein